MTYSLSQITTKADCDALIESANLEREDIQFRKTQQDRSYRTVSTGSSGVEAELSGVITEIAGAEMAIQTLPDGPTKKLFESRLTKLKYRKFLLEERKVRFGVFTLLEKEYVITRTEQELNDNQAYLDALIERNAQL
jgi:hypothetical protein